MRHEQPSWSYQLEDGREACFLFTTKQHGDLSSDQNLELLNSRQRQIVDEKWSYLTQVHGSSALQVLKTGQHQGTQGDALYTDKSDAPISIQVADCAPIALISPAGGIGLIHAGWKGLIRGVVDITVEAMAGIDTKPTIAVLGPCIHPDFYEFGEEQMKKICEIFGEDIRAKTREGSLALNLPKMVEIALIKNNITELVRFDKCTSNSEEFWSYRVRNDEKRQAVIGWIKPKETSFD